MRIGVISDIHANLAALEQVLYCLDAAGVEEIYCLGDVVGYGPFPNECVELVRTRCTGTVFGNHDAALFGKITLDRFDTAGRKALRWTQKIIRPDNLKYLSALPPVLQNHDATFIHSSPFLPESWEYIHTYRQAEKAFQALTTPIGFIGHTHVPMIIGEDQKMHTVRKGSRFLVNVGSVGQPRDGIPGAAFGVFDTASWSYQPMRVEYDVETTTEAIRKAGLPSVLAERLINGL
jgi:diadenosine tetraphosphatase ApaH/serine/threonine PP2A family protein phosphatase